MCVRFTRVQSYRTAGGTSWIPAHVHDRLRGLRCARIARHTGKTTVEKVQQSLEGCSLFDQSSTRCKVDIFCNYSLHVQLLTPSYACAGFDLTQSGPQLLSYAEMLASATNICSTLNDIPCIGDGDTGYGNALNVKRTVKGYAQVHRVCTHQGEQQVVVVNAPPCPQYSSGQLAMITTSATSKL